MQPNQMPGMGKINQQKRPHNASNVVSDYEINTSRKRRRNDWENPNNQQMYATNCPDCPALYNNVTPNAFTNQSNSIYHQENNIPIESGYFQPINARNLYTPFQEQTAMPTLQENYDPCNQQKNINVQEINVSIKDQNQFEKLRKYYSYAGYNQGTFSINHRFYDELRKEDKKQFDTLCERALNLTDENIEEIKHDRLKYQKRNCKRKNGSKWESAKPKNQKRRS